MQAVSAWLTPGVRRVLLAILATGSWMFVSTYLILLNKHLMVDLNFKYPMTVSGMGMVTSGLLSFMCCWVFKVVDLKTHVTWDFWVRKCLPVGFFMALTLWTGNEVYLYLTVAFIQMLKAFTPVITMIALFVAKLEDPSRAIILSVIITAAGTALAAWGEMRLSILGLIIMMTSETGEAIRLVMTQFLLTGLKFHPIEGLMYLSPACSLWLLAGACILEFPQIQSSGSWQIMLSNPVLFGLAAVLGFTVNTLAYTSIKLASSLTLKVLGTAKNALLVVLSVVFLGEIVTGVQAVGYVISLIGFGWYNQIKMAQIASSAEAAAQSASTNVKDTEEMKHLLLDDASKAAAKNMSVEGFTTSPHTRIVPQHSGSIGNGHIS